MFADDPDIRVRLNFVAVSSAGEMLESMNQVEFSRLPEEYRGFFRNRKHQKIQIAKAKEAMAEAIDRAKEIYGAETRIVIRASMEHGSQKEQIFQLSPKGLDQSQSPKSEDPSEDSLSEDEGATPPALTSEQDQENNTESQRLGVEITHASLFNLASKVSKHFNEASVDHQYRPIRKWYAYVAAKLGIESHDVFCGLTTATIMALAIHPVNSWAIHELVEGGYKLNVPPEVASGVITSWVAGFESATVLFSAFYIHWANQGNLLFNRMKIATFYLAFPVLFGIAIGLPPSEGAAALSRGFEGWLHINGTEGLDPSTLANIGGRFADGLWRAFWYVLPTHLVYKSLGEVKNKIVQSFGSMSTVLAANFAVFIGFIQNMESFKIADVEQSLRAFFTGEVSSEIIASFSESLPHVLQQFDMTTSSVTTASIGLVGLLAYPIVLYKNWVAEQKTALGPEAKTSIYQWAKGLGKKYVDSKKLPRTDAEDKETEKETDEEAKPAQGNSSCFMQWFKKN